MVQVRLGAAGQLRGALEVELDYLGRQRRPVLDGVHARLERDADALGALDVRHDWKLEPMRLAAGGLGDERGHAQHAGLADLGGVEHAPGDEQLDDVGALGHELADEQRGLLRRVDGLGEQPGAVSARHGDAGAGGDDARPVRAAGVDGVAHGDVGEQGVAGPAQRRHAAHELRLRALEQHAPHDGAPGAVVEAAHERPGVARGHGLARAAEVDVHVDEARHEVGAVQVDDACTRGDLRDRRGLDAGDLRLLDDDGHVGLRAHVGAAVEDGGVHEGGDGVSSGHGGLQSLTDAHSVACLPQGGAREGARARRGRRRVPHGGDGVPLTVKKDGVQSSKKAFGPASRRAGAMAAGRFPCPCATRPLDDRAPRGRAPRGAS